MYKISRLSEVSVFGGWIKIRRFNQGLGFSGHDRNGVEILIFRFLLTSVLKKIRSSGFRRIALVNKDSRGKGGGCGFRRNDKQGG